LLIWLEDRDDVPIDYLFYVSYVVEIPALKPKAQNQIGWALKFILLDRNGKIIIGSRSINLFSDRFRFGGFALLEFGQELSQV